MSERLKEHDWKSCRRLYRLEGSNPSLSATSPRNPRPCINVEPLAADTTEAASPGSTGRPRRNEMSFVAKNLMPGEAVTYRAVLHWNVYVKPVLSLLLAAGASFFVPSPYTWIAAAVLVTPALIWLLAVHVQRASAEFAITNRRLIVKT